MLETIILSIIMVPMLLLIVGAGLMMITYFWLDVDDVVSRGPISAVISNSIFAVMCIAWISVGVLMFLQFFCN